MENMNREQMLNEIKERLDHSHGMRLAEIAEFVLYRPVRLVAEGYNTLNGANEHTMEFEVGAGLL